MIIPGLVKAAITAYIYLLGDFKLILLQIFRC